MSCPRQWGDSEQRKYALAALYAQGPLRRNRVTTIVDHPELPLARRKASLTQVGD
jgi:hypothetical protein